MTKGYFPDRVIPPINAIGLEAALPAVATYCKAKPLKQFPHSYCVGHSVPKRKHLRRTLSTPNPLHQYLLSQEISLNYSSLQDHCRKSELTLTFPILGSKRALAPEHDLGEQPLIRAQRCAGARYLLRTDIARYYPSIYTHSIPWSLHQKSYAKANKTASLLGNRLDAQIRNCQGQQTSGIPIGPDTSFLIGEVIATTLDLKLKECVPNLRGTRNIDDYHLYFDSISEAETALAMLHTIAKQMELDINDPKTEIVQMPTALEPSWKSDLRNLQIRRAGKPQATDLMSLFDRAFEHSKHFPADSVLTYAAKQVLSAEVSEDNWLFCEAMLLQAAVSEPTMLSVLVDIYKQYGDFAKAGEPLSNAIHSICSYHAPLQQGNEVSWALWLAKRTDTPIIESVGNKIAGLDDDVVALISLDLQQHGLFKSTKIPLWESNMNAHSLNEAHWLLAYESQQHNWPTVKSIDYIKENEFFALLRDHDVCFYSDDLAPTSSSPGYFDDPGAAFAELEDLFSDDES